MKKKFLKKKRENKAVVEKEIDAIFTNVMEKDKPKKNAKRGKK